jgi:hypothetical protein
MESNDQGLDTMVKGWIPQNCDVDNMLCRLSSTSDEIKEFYNERFDEITKSHNPYNLVVLVYNTESIAVHGIIFCAYFFINTV